MNLWAAFLADTPSTLQRLIARRHRISLPRGCSAHERLNRLRQALCHARTVRAIYFSLSRDAQAALQELRARERGLSPDELTDRFGPIRPYSHIAADFKPHSISEQLLLLGFLLPRPASHRHPTRFLLPPEVRAWLPRPLNLPDHGPAPALSLPLAVRAARALLLCCAERPLPICTDGALRAESLRAVLARLALPDQDEAAALCRFLWPLLTEMGLLAPHGSAAALAPAGQRFLGYTPQQQLAQLRAAWVRAPRGDAWVQSLRVNLDGLDWPLLRRRLLVWAATLPAARLLDPASLYSALADALGPLADAQTHGFRCCPPDRAPWQPKRAALVWDAALRGPLAWLGAVAWTDQQSSPLSPSWVFRPPTDADDLPLLENEAQAWQYGALGEIQVPHATLDRTLLALLPFARWQHSSPTHVTYQITRRTLAAAARAGHHPSALRKLLTRQAGPLPPEWDTLLGADVPAVQITYAAVVTSDDPRVLSRARQARSVRRYLEAQLAPGVAVARPERAPALARAIERQGLAVTVQGQPQIARPRDFTPAECATLLEVCRGYRELAEPEAVPPHLDVLEERLRAALPPTLQTSLTPAPDDTVEGEGTPAILITSKPGEEVEQTPVVRSASESGEGEREKELLELPTLAPVGALALVLTTLSLLLGLLCSPRRWRWGKGDQAMVDEPIERPDVAPAAALAPPTTTLTEAQADPELLAALGRAIGRREVLQIAYCDATGKSSTRIIRPLRLEQHGSCFYLHAFCTLRRAERVFRVDRLGAWSVLGRRPRRGDPLMRRLCPPTEPPTPPASPPRRSRTSRAGFFAPPATPEGSPLIRVWLEE